MRGIALTALLVHLFVCQTIKSEESGECHICCIAEYASMKEFFDCWSAKPGVRSVRVPKTFNWIIKRQMRKELDGPMRGENFIRSLIEGVESISLLDYEKLDEDDSLKLEEEISRIADNGSAASGFRIIYSGAEAAGGGFTRLIIHSKESKAFMILMGKFSNDICTD